MEGRGDAGQEGRDVAAGAGNLAAIVDDQPPRLLEEKVGISNRCHSQACSELWLLS